VPRLLWILAAIAATTGCRQILGLDVWGTWSGQGITSPSITQR
jgi:hypothetical protein